MSIIDDDGRFQFILLNDDGNKLWLIFVGDGSGKLLMMFVDNEGGDGTLWFTSNNDVGGKLSNDEEVELLFKDGSGVLFEGSSVSSASISSMEDNNHCHM